MAASDCQDHPCVIVIGDRHSDFGKEVGRLAAEYHVAVTPCDDVYSAATELVGRRDRFLMVTGTFRQLIRGKGDFFALAERNGVPCCCLLDEKSDVGRDKILTALRLRVRLAGEMADLRRFLEDWLAAGGHRGHRAGEEEFLREQFRATEDELNALLRQETDG